MGFKWVTYSHDYGTVQVYSDSKHGAWDNRIANFKCCTGCHLPINQTEATRINRELGLELAAVEVDDDVAAPHRDGDVVPTRSEARACRVPTRRRRIDAEVVCAAVDGVVAIVPARGASVVRDA